MILTIALLLAAGTAPDSSSDVSAAQAETRQPAPSRSADCTRKIRLVTGDEQTAPMMRQGPAAKDEALMLLAVDTRVAECPVLVTFDGTIREPIALSERKTGWQPVAPN